MSELQITGLHKSFGATQVLEGLELSVPAGSLTAILGASGSGKTTLLRVLAGLLRADRGTIEIGGRIVDGRGEHVPAERRHVGYVPQEGALFPHLTVKANITFGLARRERRGGARELLETVGLTDLAGRYPHQLSGGQQQRVALARALAVRPEIVLLDEPFASLDAGLRANVREDVQAILRKTRTTTLLVTHDQDEALSTADQIAVLRDGQIAQCATPHDLYAKPIDQKMARFIGDANLVAGVMEDGFVRTWLGRLPAIWRGNADDLRDQRPATVLIRPEQIKMYPANGDGSHLTSEGGALTARVVGIGYHGHDSLLNIQIDDAPDAGPPLIVRSLGHAHPPIGSKVRVSVKDTVLVWPA